MLGVADAVVTVLIVLAIILAYVNKGKAWADKMIIKIAYEIESYLRGEEGQRKLNILVDILLVQSQKLPLVMRILIKPFITQRYANEVVQSILEGLNTVSKNTKLTIEGEKLKAVSEGIEELKKQDFFGDNNLVSNFQLDEYKKSKIEGYAKVTAEIIGDIKKSNAKIEAGIKF